MNQQPTFPTRLPLLAFAGRFAGEADVDVHCHDCAELVLITRGACSVEIGETRLEGRVGTLFLLPARQPQYQHTYGFTQTTYVGLWNPSPLLSQEGQIFDLYTHPYLVRWIEDLCDLTQKTAEVPDEVTGGLLLALLGCLTSLRPRAGLVDAPHPALQQAVYFLETRVTEPFSLQRLANYVHMSESHLAALFRTKLHCSPLKYHQQLRMRLAEALLRDPSLTVNEVSARCGYDDPNYFARLFRQRHRCSPREWRASLIEDGSRSGNRLK